MNCSEYFSNKVKWLSIVATWAVVGIHSRTTEWTAGVVDWSSQLQDFMIAHFSFAVPFFFLLSGYWFMKSYEKYGWGGLLVRKAKTLYIPFVCWCLIGELAVLPSALFEPQEFSREAIAGVPILLMNGLHLSWHLWYVRGLLVFFLLAPICFQLGRHWFLPILVVVCAWLWPTLRLGPYYFGYVAIAVHWFFAGCLCSTYNLLERVVSRRRSISFMALAIIGILVLDCVEDWGVSYLPTRYELRIVCMVVVLWFGYDVLHVMTKPPRWLQGTFFIYCLHTCVIRYTGNGLRYFFGVTPLVKTVSFVFNMCSFWIDVLIAALTMRYMPRVYRILAGGR